MSEIAKSRNEILLADRRRRWAETVLQSPYHLQIKNICKDRMMSNSIPSIFYKYSSIRGTRFLDEDVTVADIKFSDEDELKQAVEELEKQEDWKFNRGFKLKVLGMKTYVKSEDEQGFASSWITLGKRIPDFLGDGADDVLENFGAAYIVQLPRWHQRKPELRMDIRMKRGHYEHPVIIVKNHGNGLVNIVLVSGL